MQDTADIVASWALSLCVGCFVANDTQQSSTSAPVTVTYQTGANRHLTKNSTAEER